MIFIGCNVCRSILDPADTGNVTEGSDGFGNRIDICGKCMREARERVLAAIADRQAILDPVPESVRQRALRIKIPDSLRKST